MSHRPHPVRSSSGVVRWLAILLLVVAVALIYMVIDQRRRGAAPPPTVARPHEVVIPKDLGADEQATIAVFENASRSVVHVTSLSQARSRYTMDVMDIPQGTGSGFVWDASGYIVTNFHVIQHGTAAKVTFADGSAHDADIVGSAPDKDLAVLRLRNPPAGLVPLPVGSSANLRVGQKVLAIGNPFGLDQTLTTGVISGLGREIQAVTKRPITDVIQTDAAINRGNSGGPLLDSQGNLIGINTAILSPSGAYAGIGFAVPVDTINSIVPQIIATNGTLQRPGLGVSILSDDHARRNRVTGVVIMNVQPGSAADRAGLQGLTETPRGWAIGDVIVGIDGEPIRGQNDLFKALDKRKVGDRVRVRVRRGGVEREVEVTLQAIQS